MMASEADQTVVSVREGLAQFDARGTENPPVVFADGIHQVGIGGAITKVTFYVSPGNKSENGTPIEQRTVTFTLAIPTAAFLEGIMSFLDQAKTNKDGLKMLAANTAATIDRILAS